MKKTDSVASGESVSAERLLDDTVEHLITVLGLAATLEHERVARRDRESGNLESSDCETRRTTTHLRQAVGSRFEDDEEKSDRHRLLCEHETVGEFGATSDTTEKRFGVVRDHLQASVQIFQFGVRQLQTAQQDWFDTCDTVNVQPNVNNGPFFSASMRSALFAC